MEERDRRGASLPRADQGDHRLSRTRSGRSAHEVSVRALHHRRAADGRDEHRRQSLRRRQDVPAAGGEERASDEEGGGLASPVHGGGESEDGRSIAARQGAPGYGEGRRPRHWEKHCRSRPRLQQLSGSRSRRDGFRGEDPGHSDGGEGGHRRPVRPDHAIAG